MSGGDKEPGSQEPGKQRPEKKPYEVGYGKPPKDSQFKPGRSGNKSGGPKKRAEPVKLDEVLDQPVTVTKGGKKQKMEPMKVALLAQIKKAQKGDLRALTHVLSKFTKHGVLGSDQAKRVAGVVTLPDNMPFEMARLIALRFGLPPWSKAQEEKGKEAYIAQRSERQATIDNALGYFGDE